MLTLRLPYPPTGNKAVRHTRQGHHYATDEVKHYQAMVRHIVRAEGVLRPYIGPVAVVMEWAPPDRRKRDFDNVWKTLGDALTKAGIWLDDSQVFDFQAIRKANVKGGSVVVTVQSIQEDA